MTRVLVCGGRDFTDKALLINTLDKFCEDHGYVSEKDEYGNWLPQGITIVHGTARGADSLAEDWAIVNWVPYERFPANWKEHGRAAGPIRNKEMLDSGVDYVIAFPGGVGTAHMVSIARQKGVPVLVVEPTKRS